MYPEVVAKPKRRQFTAEYRLRILEEADRCMQPGEVGRLLRRERDKTVRTSRRMHDAVDVRIGATRVLCKPLPLPEAVWINPPAKSTTGETAQ